MVDEKQTARATGRAPGDRDGNTLADRIEQDTMGFSPAQRRGAAARFRALPTAEQLELIEEQVTTRRRDLCAAYDNLVAVDVGNKEQRDRRSGARRLRKTPCVVFTVRRKWADDETTETDPRQVLPKHLYAFWTIDDARVLCAMPTDVVEVASRARFEPEAGSGNLIKVPQRGDKGSVSCVIERLADPGARYIMSCNHVLGARDAPRREVLDTRDSVVATVTGPRGAFPVGGARFALDARLAKLVPGADVRRLLGGVRYDATFATRFSSLPDEYYILGSQTGPVRVRRHTLIEPARLGYADGERKFVALFSSQFTGRETTGGDSGAPVMTERTGGRLLGIHLGKLDGRSVALPAWIIMNPFSYIGPRSGDHWFIIDS